MKPLRALMATGMLAGLCAQTFAAFSHFGTFYNTDWTSAAIGGMRGVGSQSLSLSGVSGTVSAAYLFWHGPTNSNNPLVNATVNFNGNVVVGTNVGISEDNNWGYDNSMTYRADVSAFVSGNGTFSLANFIKPNANINGASLYVTYNDGNSTNNRDLVLFNGNDSNIYSSYDLEGWDVTLNGINYSGGPASIRLTVSDGQKFGDDEEVYLNGNILMPVGENWQGDLGPQIVGNGSLWDEKDLNIAPLLILGNNNLHFQTFETLTDALSLVVAAIDLKAGDAPQPDGAVPEPSTYGLIGAAALIAGITLRRKLRK